MPRFYCDYCDAYLTHDSRQGRRQHNRGQNHRENFRIYYQKYFEAYNRERQGMHSMMLVMPGMLPPGAGFARPPILPPGMSLPPQPRVGFMPPPRAVPTASVPFVAASVKTEFNPSKAESNSSSRSQFNDDDDSSRKRKTEDNYDSIKRSR